MARLRVGTAESNRILMALVNKIDEVSGAGQVDFLDGTQPANNNTAITTQNVAAEVVLNNPCVATQTITAASWAASVATFTIAAHGRAVDDRVVIAGVTPSGYNGEFTVTAVTTNTFDVAMTSDPGTYTSGGTAKFVGGGQIELDLPSTVMAGLTTTVTWARVYADNGTPPADTVFDGDVGVTGSGAAFEANTVAFENTKNVDITQANIKIAAS